VSAARGAPRTGAGHVDIVARLQRRRAEAHEAERRLIDCILGDLHFAASAPIARIAERAGISEPTITRLARALGLSGTRDLRFHLAQALAIGGAYLRATDAPPAPADGGVIAQVSGGAHAALDLMCAALGEVDLPGLVGPLVEARQIVVCGTGGGSSMAAREMQNRLFRLGLSVSAHSDPQLQRMSASALGADCAALGFSLSGQARSVIDAVLIARQYGARTIAVTVPGTPLAEAAEALLPLTFREDGKLYKPTSSRYALLAAVDILAMAAAEAIGPGVIETLRRVRQSLASQDIRNPDLPIGD